MTTTAHHRWNDVPDDIKARATAAVAARVPWGHIARLAHVGVDTVRRAFDPAYGVLRNEQAHQRRGLHTGGVRGHRAQDSVGNLPARDIAARLAEIPPDTRPLTARLMGDPLPSRSALDRRQAGEGPW